MSQRPTTPSVLHTSSQADTPTFPPPYLDTIDTTGQVPLPDTCIVPWKTGFKFGFGVDALTGTSKPQAVKKFAIEFTTSGDISQYIHLCSDTDSVRRTFRRHTSTHATLNFEPVDLSAGYTAGALGDVRYSTTTFCLVVRWISIHRTESSSSYELEKDALDILCRDITEFRRTYGDYFVAGQGRGAQFDAVLTFKCQNSERRAAAIKSLSAKSGITVSSAHTTGSADIEQNLSCLADVSKDCVGVSMHIKMRGADLSQAQSLPGPLDVEDIKGQLSQANPVLQNLKWFREHLDPSPVHAELRPYNLLGHPAVRALPTTLPVTVSAFTEIEKIRSHLLNCTTTRAALGDVLHYAQPLQERLETFLKMCSQHQPQLPADDELRARLLKGAAELSAEYSRFFAAWDLWVNLYNALPYEGPQEAKRGGHFWPLGRQECMTYPLRIFKRTFEVETISKPFLSFIPFKRRYRQLSTAELSSSPEEIDSASMYTAETAPRASVVSLHPGPEERIVGWNITSVHGQGAWRALRPRNGLLLSLTELRADRGSRMKPESFLFSVASGRLYPDKWHITLYLIADNYFDIIMNSGLGGGVQ